MSFDLTITASALVAVLGMIIGWVRLRNEALNKRLEAQSGRLDRHEARVSSVEQTLQAMPGRDEMHKIELGISEIRGDMRALSASMEGNSKVMLRLEAVVSRQEDHLMNGARK